MMVHTNTRLYTHHSPHSVKLFANGQQGKLHPHSPNQYNPTLILTHIQYKSPSVLSQKQLHFAILSLTHHQYSVWHISTLITFTLTHPNPQNTTEIFIESNSTWFIMTNSQQDCILMEQTMPWPEALGGRIFIDLKKRRIARAMRVMVSFGLLTDMYRCFLWFRKLTFFIFYFLYVFVSQCSLLKMELAFKEEKRNLFVSAYFEYLWVDSFILPFSSDYEWFIYAYCTSMYIYIYCRWGLSYVTVSS